MVSVINDFSELWKCRSIDKHRITPTPAAPAVYLTRYAGAEGHEGDGVDAVLEVNEAPEMAGNVSDDGCAEPDSGDGDHEGGISVGNAWLFNTNMLDKLRCYLISNI